MRAERRSGTDERKILTAMITNSTVLGRIAARWNTKSVTDPGLFRSSWANLVGRWCVDFYREYHDAPKSSIESLFSTWSESESVDKDTVKIVEAFLNGISEDYEKEGKEVNADYVIDLAGVHFNRCRLERLKEQIDSHLSNGEVDEALKQVDSWHSVELGGGAGVDVLTDQDAIREAFESKSEPLITYPGALGDFFAGALERDALVSFMGPEKRGKTWWLMDIAWRGLLERRKVAFFEVGDMSQNQIMRRFMARAAKRPLKPGTIKFPTEIKFDEELRRAVPVIEEKTFEDGLAWGDAWHACQKVLKQTKTNRSLLRLSCHPNSSISVLGIESVIKHWETDGWVPDIIVIDYADILAPPSGVQESRDQINQTWKQLRALSQKYHCLVVTATQAAASSYAVETVTRLNFSEDKRKLAHVTGMVGLSATPEEKDDGIIRVNWVVLREGEFSEYKCCHVAGCLPIGAPAIRSLFWDPGAPEGSDSAS